MTTSSPGSVPSGSLVLSPASLLAALLDLLLPGSCGGCAAPGTGWCAGCAAQLGPPLWPVLPGGLAVLGRGPVPRAAAQRRSRVQGTRAARPRRPTVLPAHSAAGPDGGRGRRVARPGSVAAVGGPGPRRRPRAAAVPAPGAGRSRAVRRARAPAGQASARLGRAGRRGSGRRTWRGASGWTLGPCRRRARRWSLSTTSSPPARRYGPAGRPSLGPIATLRQLSFLPTRPHGKHQEIPEWLPKKLRTVALAPIGVTRTSDLLSDCDQRYRRRCSVRNANGPVRRGHRRLLRSRAPVAVHPPMPAP